MLEGVDRAGKSTQSRKLVAALCAAGHRAEQLRFPGGWRARAGLARPGGGGRGLGPEDRAGEQGPEVLGEEGRGTEAWVRGPSRANVLPYPRPAWLFPG